MIVMSLLPQLSKAQITSFHTTQPKPARYGTNHNILFRGRDIPQNPFLNDLIPAPRLNQDLRGRSQDSYYSSRELKTDYALNRKNWDDDQFEYPNYRFSYEEGKVVPGPGYFFEALPGYIAIHRILIDLPGSMGPSSNIKFIFTPKQGHRWDPKGNYNQTSKAYPFDIAMRDIYEAIAYKRPRLMNYTTGDDNLIRITLLEKSRAQNVMWQYQMTSDQYYAIMEDLINLVDTANIVFAGAAIGEIHQGNAPAPTIKPGNPYAHQGKQNNFNKIDQLANILQGIGQIGRVLSKKPISQDFSRNQMPAQTRQQQEAYQIHLIQEYKSPWNESKKMHHLFTLIRGKRGITIADHLVSRTDPYA